MTSLESDNVIRPPAFVEKLGRTNGDTTGPVVDRCVEGVGVANAKFMMRASLEETTFLHSLVVMLTVQKTEEPKYPSHQPDILQRNSGSLSLYPN